MEIIVRFHMDDRGIRYCDIFPEIGKGDINITIIESGAVALWHRHENQTDYQFVIKGSLKIGIANLPSRYHCDDGSDRMEKDWQEKYYHIHKDSYNASLARLRSAPNKYIKYSKIFEKTDARCDWHYLSERNANQGPLFIPAGLWHGCYNYTNEPAILCYHITNKWDGTDEERCDPDILGWKYERIVK
jgi:hypothetical protein